MAKKKRFAPKSGNKDTNGRSGAKETISDTDSSDDFDDHMNHFHTKKDKELLERSALSQDMDSDDEDYGSDDEVMPLDESSDSDDDSGDGLNRFGIELKKDGMASDLEDDSDDQTEQSSAWGNQKKVFYNTDYVDKDFRKYTPKDSDLADFEEEEALQIQKRLLESISEADVGLELLVGDIEPKTGFNDRSREDLEEDEERLETNLSNLTKRQKLEILRKESPELEALITDFQTTEGQIISGNGNHKEEVRKLKSKQSVSFSRKRTKKAKTVGNEKRVKFADDIDVSELTAPEAQEVGETDATAKRGITYEMAKNKGLTPKRKKELKNPR
ncbi:unnamed protein product, partial [Oppiella nova]